MDTQTGPILLEGRAHFDDRHPVGVQLDTALPGQVLLIGMRAGQRLRDHRVATPITIQVIRGEGTVTVGDAAYPAQPGAFFSLPANAPHSATAGTDLVLLVHRAAVVEAEIVESDAVPLFAGTDPATLDVRDLVPRDRHARIFATFEALRPGEAFRLVNDHDPKPLKYQFAAEHAGEATWEPEQTGPQTWIIRIGKSAHATGA
jgi:uncharacterized protein (DUF2249 family)/quercetin dioxygenase-like cupin family protein